MNSQPPSDALSVLEAIGLVRFAFPAMLAFVSFLFTLVALTSRRRPLALSMLPFVMGLPLLVCVFIACRGITMSLMVISNSTVSVKPAELAEALWIMEMDLLVGALLCLPAYVVGLFGLLWKSLRPGPVSNA